MGDVMGDGEGTERALTHQRMNLTMIPEAGVVSYMYITCIIRVFHVFYRAGLETFVVIISLLVSVPT